jgi:hypothetical protein
MISKDDFLELIRTNIRESGFHITMVNSKTEPRYAYTIGLSDKIGCELIFAGGLFFSRDELISVFHDAARILINRGQIKENPTLIECKIGYSFSLAKVHDSWAEKMMLGVYDFYKINTISGTQILPQGPQKTLDVPDMNQNFDPLKEPVWRWLDKEWDLPIPEDSYVLTNIDVLQGYLITEIVRCDDNEWEMFTGNPAEIPKKEKRIVPFGTLLSIDNTIEEAMFLKVGKGYWRESQENGWQKWG